MALIRPPVNILPPVTLPLALKIPLTYSPVVANTVTLDTPPTETATLAPEPVVATVVEPLAISVTAKLLTAVMLLINPPSPKRYPAAVTLALASRLTAVTLVKL